MATNSKTASSVNNYREIVYKIVREIPEGRVITYGQIATIIQKYESVFSTSRKAKIKMQKYKTKFKINNRFLPRLVGFVLHMNQDHEVPCHRVVDRNGRLAPNFGFGGWEEQKRRLVTEGVQFKDEKQVDLSKCLWKKLRT